MSVDHATEWDEWSRDWQMSLRGRGVALNTLAVYSRGVAQFTAYLEQSGHDLDLSTVTGRHVDGWMASLADAGRSNSTRRVRLMTLRSLFGWMLEEPQTPLRENPAGKTKAPVAELPMIAIVSDDDIRAVLATCKDNSYVDLRDQAIVRLLASTGLRRSELVGLDATDLDISAGQMYVMGKGSKPRVVSFGGSKTPLALSRYLRARRKHPGAKDAALFLSTRPSQNLGYRMTGGGIGEMLKRRAKYANIKPFKPHQLRHTWAHQSKVAGLSDEDLERMAGWSSPMMVRRYGRAMADERARDAHKNLGLGDAL